MKKITYLITLLFAFVGVMPMMAQTNLGVEEGVKYTIKATIGGGIVRYVYAGAYAGANSEMGYEENPSDLNQEKFQFTFEYVSTTTDGFKVYKIHPVAHPSNNIRFYDLNSKTGEQSSICYSTKSTYITWAVIEDNKDNKVFHRIRYVKNGKLSGDYWSLYASLGSNKVSCTTPSNSYENPSYLVIERVGSGEGGGEGGGESGGNEGGSGETTTENLPTGVTVSQAPTAQKEWAEDSHFYTIKNGNGQYLTNDVKVGQNFTFQGSTNKPDKSGYWCVVGNAQDGYSFYNYETGQILAMSSSKIQNVDMLESYSMAYLRDIGALQGDDDHKFVFTESKVEGQSLFCIKVLNTENIYWIAHPTFSDKLGYRKNDDALSNPAAGFTFEEVFPFKPMEDANLTNTLISNAESAMDKTGLGYPTADCPERAPLIAAIAAATENPTSQDLYDDLAAAYKNFLKSPYVTMPEDGKAYVFKSLNKNLNLSYLYDKEGELSFSGQDYSGDVEAKFICRKLSVSDNGTSANYAFVNNNGQFLIWKGSEGGADGNDGFASEYSAVTLKKMVVAGNEENLFGTMTISEGGKLFARTLNNGFSTTAMTTCFDSNFSTAFIIEEVSYPNIVTLTEVTADDKLCEDFLGKTIGTFSAPFATVLPANVTAYNVETADGYAFLRDISKVLPIPANFGVILVGDDSSVTSALIKPRTTEKITELSNFRLSHSAGAPVVIGAGDYILANGGQGIGFYESNPGTLAMNKAFLRFGASQTSAFRLVLGEEVTGINGVATEKADAPIYDLSGRRVLNTVKGGIYIQNGKKFIVK